MYYFKNSSGNRGFIFPGGFLVNDNQGSLPIYYSLWDTYNDGNKKWINVTDYLIVMQGFRLDTHQWSDWPYPVTQSLDRSNSSTPRYQRVGAKDNEADFNATRGCILYFNGSTTRFEGTDT